MLVRVFAMPSLLSSSLYISRASSRCFLASSSSPRSLRIAPRLYEVFAMPSLLSSSLYISRASSNIFLDSFRSPCSSKANLARADARRAFASSIVFLFAFTTHLLASLVRRLSFVFMRVMPPLASYALRSPIYLIFYELFDKYNKKRKWIINIEFKKNNIRTRRAKDNEILNV